MITKVLFAMLVVGVGPVSVSFARDNHTGEGGAIVPAFTVRHDAMRPDEDVELVCCVTNDNGHSSHHLATGDAFRFEFRDGTLGTCHALEVFSPSETLADEDFACSLADGVLVLTYLGPESPWPLGDMACARIGYHSGAASSTVLASYRVTSNGAYAPPQPSAIPLSVARDIGSVGPRGPEGAVGPVGPTGPAGPTGPPGPAAAGARVLVESTGAIRAADCDDPVLVPGLEAEIAITPGATLLVALDVYQHSLCEPPGGFSHSLGTMAVEVDGTRVATRILDLTRGGGSSGGGTEDQSVPIVWLSGPLAGGTHVVRVTIVNDESCHPFDNRLTDCVGSGADDGRVARLVVVELPN
jgi:hypothetical protein